MFAPYDHEILALIRSRGLLPPGPLAALAEEARAAGRPLADALLATGTVARARLLAVVAESLGLEFCDVPPARLDPALAARVRGGVARHLGVAPWRIRDGILELLCVDPFPAALATDAAFALGENVRLVVADPGAVAALIAARYGAGDALGEAPGDAGAEETPATGADSAVAALRAQAAQAPVVRLVDTLLEQAVRDGASDIHFEPFENEFAVRCRVDGTLRPLAPVPPALARPVISRLKVLANLDIAECRQPQDGRLRGHFAGRPVDLRISTLPTQQGESVVLRVLERSGRRLDLEALGLPDEVRAGVTAAIGRPHGLFIVTGPTGSGKTTTLYGCLHRLHEPGSKLLTVEDPVEYEIEGVLQVPVNPAAGLGFAPVLRAFLRHDPDVILVGEIRDLETARIAVQAALTGHLVLTTLHTGDAPGAVTRLVDMGVEPFLLAAALEGVLAQRLLRRVCPDCRRLQVPTPEQLALLAEAAGPLAGRPLPVAVGCGRCSGTGYSGRTGIFEFLRVDEDLRERIGRAAPGFALREQALARGMRSLRSGGLALVAAGATTLEEVLTYV